MRGINGGRVRRQIELVELSERAAQSARGQRKQRSSSNASHAAVVDCTITFLPVADGADLWQCPGVSSVVTRGIRVTVESQYVAEQSMPRQHHYVFAYHVTIANEGSETL